MTGVSILEKIVSRDVAVKYLFELDDGNIIEDVLIGSK